MLFLNCCSGQPNSRGWEGVARARARARERERERGTGRQRQRDDSTNESFNSSQQKSQDDQGTSLGHDDLKVLWKIMF